DRIDQAMAEIQSGGLLNAALTIDPRTDQLPPLEQLPGRDYLGTLIASHGFRRALQDYQDVAALAANLRWWQDRLSSFEVVLADRRGRFEQRLPQLQQQLAALAPDALQERYQALKIGLPLGSDTDLRTLEQQLA